MSTSPRPHSLFPRPHALQQDTVVARLVKVFEWLEAQGLRVGSIWLNPKQARELFVGHRDVFDREVDPIILRHHVVTKGATLLGYLFGALVFEADLVPYNHVGAIPEDWDAKLLGSAGCMPF